MCWTLGLELHKCYLFSCGCAKDWQLTVIVLLRKSTISIFLIEVSAAARAPTTVLQQRNLPNTRRLLIIPDLSGSSKHVVLPPKSSCKKGSLTTSFWSWKFLLFLEVAISNHYYLKWRNLVQGSICRRNSWQILKGMLFCEAKIWLVYLWEINSGTKMGSLPEEKNEKEGEIETKEIENFFYYLNHFKIKWGFLYLFF